MGGMIFSNEPFSEQLLAEMLPLLEAHWHEVAHYPDIPLEVDTAAYLAAQANGALRLYTVRENDAAELLRGYAVFFVRGNVHYASSIQASQDVIYVSPAARGSTGARLIRFAEQELRDDGVQAVYHHVKTAHNWGKLLERMGYEAVDVIYAKRLDRPIVRTEMPPVSWRKLGETPSSDPRLGRNEILDDMPYAGEEGG